MDLQGSARVHMARDLREPSGRVTRGTLWTAVTEIPHLNSECGSHFGQYPGEICEGDEVIGSGADGKWLVPMTLP